RLGRAGNRIRLRPAWPRTTNWSTVRQVGATCCTTKKSRWAFGSLNVRVTTRRLFGPVVAIHVREGRKRPTFGAVAQGPELFAPAGAGESPLEVMPAVEPGPAVEPATDDACGSGARAVEVGTCVTLAGSGTLTAVVATGGGGSVETVVGTVGT